MDFIYNGVGAKLVLELRSRHAHLLGSVVASHRRVEKVLLLGAVGCRGGRHQQTVVATDVPIDGVETAGVYFVAHGVVGELLVGVTSKNTSIFGLLY